MANYACPVRVEVSIVRCSQSRWKVSERKSATRPVGAPPGDVLLLNEWPAIPWLQTLNADYPVPASRGLVICRLQFTRPNPLDIVNRSRSYLIPGKCPNAQGPAVTRNRAEFVSEV